MRASYVTLTDTETAAAAPTSMDVLDHAVVYNPTNAVVYLTVRGASGGTALDVIPIGSAFSGTIYLGHRLATAYLLATTSAAGTGAPASAIQVSLRWTRG